MLTGIIAGTIFFENKLIEEPEKRTVKTPYGNVDVLIKDNIAFIPRHGINNNIPPHKINHKAHISAFKELKIKNIIGAASSGSLKKTKLPAIAVPSDYINFNIPTFYDNKIVHITPGLSEELRNRIIKAAKNLNMNIIEKGIHIQTQGSRLETKAEINLFKNFGDFINMTSASEATLAKELNLNYAFIVSLDNYCHGLVKEELTYEKIKDNATKNSENIKKLILETIKLINND